MWTLIRNEPRLMVVIVALSLVLGVVAGLAQTTLRLNPNDVGAVVMTASALVGILLGMLMGRRRFGWAIDRAIAGLLSGVLGWNAGSLLLSALAR